MRRVVTTINEIAMSLLSLSKFRLSSLVALSALFGQLFYNLQLQNLTFLGVLFLAFACAFINQLQDRDLDPLMRRTSVREQHIERIGVPGVVVAAATLILLGLYLCNSLEAKILGTLSLLLYNLLYTPLKRRTHLAIIPGALCGLTPPWIGWVSAGGELFAYEILYVILLFFLWQFPHTWITLLKNRDDYLKTPLATLLNLLGTDALRRIFITWMLLIAILVLGAPWFLHFHFLTPKILSVLAALLFLGATIRRERGFMLTNLALVVFMLAALAEKMMLQKFP
ncbi:MAG: UbiA family prenyltransferase [Oligoflexia bacterium]|nr:UbiA family prenyltransferase [Oligoflexia bacterium]MBF0367034.1 UbiA family prenyltransferase [Oligoflexia bacterium]